MIENPTKEQIQNYLKKIGWSLRGKNNFLYFFNHKGKFANLILEYPDTDPRIVFSRESTDKPDICFYLKDVVMETFENNGVVDCVCFRGKNDKGITILCQNFDR